MSVLVRRATSEDAMAIARFALALFAQHRTYDPDRFAELGTVEGAARYYMSRADADDAAVFVAESDGEVIGFAYLEYERIDYANLLENAVWLHDLYVDERRRGTGAGKMIVQAVTEFGKERGAGKIVLTVAAKNQPALEFFQGAGFRDTMIEMTLNIT
jgi:GNAT superfamily N-acetyltransferase